MRQLPAAPSTQVNGDNVKLCRAWLDWLRAHNRSATTIYDYSRGVENFVAFLGPKPLHDVTLADIEAWIGRQRRGGVAASDATRSKDVNVARGLWKWATAHGHLLTNPTLSLETPRVRNENPKAIAANVWERFYYSPMVVDVERVTYGLAFFCGLRREELCRIEVAHIDLGRGVISGFRRKGDRGKNSGTTPVVSCARLFAQKHPSLLRSPDDFLGPLSDLVKARGVDRWLIPWGMEADTAWRPVEPKGMTSPDQINHRLRAAFKRAALPELFTPHACRHSFVTYMLRAGVELPVVSRLANHSSLNITMRYITTAEDPLAEMLEPTDLHLKGSRWQ